MFKLHHLDPLFPGGHPRHLFYDQSTGTTLGECILSCGHYFTVGKTEIELAEPLTDEQKLIFKIKYGDLPFLPVELVEQYYETKRQV